RSPSCTISICDVRFSRLSSPWSCTSRGGSFELVIQGYFKSAKDGLLENSTEPAVVAAFSGCGATAEFGHHASRSRRLQPLRRIRITQRFCTLGSLFFRFH